MDSSPIHDPNDSNKILVRMLFFIRILSTTMNGPLFTVTDTRMSYQEED